MSRKRNLCLENEVIIGEKRCTLVFSKIDQYAGHLRQSIFTLHPPLPHPPPVPTALLNPFSLSCLVMWKVKGDFLNYWVSDL